MLCIEKGKYEDAVEILEKSEWEEEYSIAVANKLKAEATIKTYIKSRKQLIAGLRIHGGSNIDSSVEDIYKGMLNIPQSLKERDLILYEYIKYLTDIGKYDDALEIIHAEKKQRIETAIEICNWKLLHVIGELYYSIGCYKDASTYFKRALEYTTQDEHIDYIEIYLGLAKCFWKVRDYKEMHKILDESSKFVKDTDNITPRQRRITSEIYKYMAIYENNCYNLTKAVKLAKKALDIYTILYETPQEDKIQEFEDKLEYARILNNISIIYKRMGKYCESSEYIARAYYIYKNYKELNPKIFRRQLVRTCRNYSIVLRKQGYFDESEKLLKEADEIINQGLLGISDVEKRLILCHTVEIGDLKLDRGKYDEAEKYYYDAQNQLTMLKSGDDFLYELLLAENCYNLGRLYRYQGKIQESENKLLEAVKIWSKYDERSTGKYTVLLAQTYAQLAKNRQKNKKIAQEYEKKKDELIRKFKQTAYKYVRKKVDDSVF